MDEKSNKCSPVKCTVVCSLTFFTSKALTVQLQEKGWPEGAVNLQPLAMLTFMVRLTINISYKTLEKWTHRTKTTTLQGKCINQIQKETND